MSNANVVWSAEDGQRVTVSAKGGRLVTDWTLDPADLEPPTVPERAPADMPEPPRCAECGLIPDASRATCLTCLSGRDGAVPPDPDDPEMQDDPVAQQQYWRDVDLDNKGRRESRLG